MATTAQIAANRENSKKSTGPKTEEGRRASSLNNLRHGFVGAFTLLESESEAQFQALWNDLFAEHQPTTPTEEQIVERMVQHWWLSERALILQGSCFSENRMVNDEKGLALAIRYHNTHERSFYKHLNQLQKLRKERRQEEIGFERQNAISDSEARRKELHEHRLRVAAAKAKWHEARLAPKNTPPDPCPEQVSLPQADRVTPEANENPPLAA